MRFVLIAVAWLLCAALADEDESLRRAAGPSDALVVAGEWAMAEVADGNWRHSVLLRRYKGEWRRVTADGKNQFSRASLLAVGVPESAARAFGLGAYPQSVVESLQRAVQNVGLRDTDYAIVSVDNTFYARTAWVYARSGLILGCLLEDVSHFWRLTPAGWTQVCATRSNSPEIFAQLGIGRLPTYRLLDWTAAFPTAPQAARPGPFKVKFIESPF